MPVGKHQLSELGVPLHEPKGWTPRASATAVPYPLHGESCERCELHRGKRTVCIPGRGARTPKFVFVGQAPGQQEDWLGRCFVGPSGQLLDHALASVGFTKDETFLTNLVKCYPPEDRKPYVKEVDACSEYLQTEFGFLPTSAIVVPVGDVAMQRLTKKRGVKKWAGTLIEHEGRNYFPIFHPSYILRVPKMMRLWLSQLKTLRNIGKAEAVPYRWKVLDAHLIRAKIEAVIHEARMDDALPPMLTIDFETTSLNPEAAEPVCAAFYMKGWRSVLVANYAANPSSFRGLVKAAATGTRWICQNWKYEARCCHRWLKVWPQYGFDTMIAHSVLDENASHALESLSSLVDCDGYDLPMRAHLAGGGTHADAPKKLLHKYNAGDVWATYQLAVKFRDELRERPKLYRYYRQHVSQTVQALARVEAFGLYVNPRTARAVAKQYRAELGQLEAQGERAGVNLSSTKDCCRYAFDVKGYPITHTTGKGEPSLKKEAIEELLVLKPKSRFLKALLRHRSVKSWLTNFVDKWPGLTDADSILHGSFNVHIAVTGRLSSSEPNLQNVPRTGEIKTVLGSRVRNGRVVQADFSQLELRVLASLSQDDRMLQAFASGIDIHRNTAAFMTGKDPDDITDDERHHGKTTNFGVIYGMGPPALADLAKISLAKARTYLRRWFTFHHGVRKLMRRWQEEVRRTGRLRSPFGRIRHLPWAQEDADGGRAVVNRALRQACNFPIQHAAAELMCMVLTRLTLGDGPDTLVGRGLETQITGTVHDSIYSDGPKREATEVAELFRIAMEEWAPAQCDWLQGVPIVADVKIGKTWAG